MTIVNLSTLLAQTELGPIGGEEGFGPFGWLGKISAAVPEQAATAVGEELASLFSKIIGVMTVVAGLWFIIQFVLGGYGFLSAGGDTDAFNRARDKIVHAIIGLVVVIAAYAIVGIIGTIFGFPILQPQEIIPKLGPGG